MQYIWSQSLLILGNSSKSGKLGRKKKQFSGTFLPPGVLHFKLSFHPLRSTLPWALLVHATGLLSFRRVLTVATGSLGVGNVVASWSVFPAVLAISHASCYVLLLPIWAEAHRYKRVAALAARLEVGRCGTLGAVHNFQ